MTEEKASGGIELDKLDLSSLMKPKEPLQDLPKESDEKALEIDETVALDVNVSEAADEDDLYETMPDTVSPAAESSPSRLKIILPVVFCIVAVAVFLVWYFTSGSFSPVDYENAGPPQSLSYHLKKSAEALSKALTDLDQVGSKISTQSKIESTIAAIGNARRMLATYSKNIDNYRNYISSNASNLRSRGMADFIALDNLYRSDIVKVYCHKLREYLDEYELFLDYYEKHWEAISAGRQPQRQTYELFNMRHKKKQSKLDAASLQYIEFIQAALDDNRVFSEFLPRSVEADTGWSNLLQQKTKR